MRRRTTTCACGRTWAKGNIAVLGRTDFMVTVRGTNVYQTAVENILNQMNGISMHYELGADARRWYDAMTVRFEPDPRSWEAMEALAKGCQ